MRPAATRPASRRDRDAEREPAALDLLEGGLGHDRAADRRGRQVRELHLVADRRAPAGEVARDRLDVACSASAITRGVPSTGTSPLRNASAVSASSTTSVTDAVRPGASGMRLTIGSMLRPGTPRRSEVSMIDRRPQSTLEHALRDGGDFAEVFVEDRRSSSARFDDGRVEELVSGRDRGAGLRVVRGDTTGFAHTADLTPRGPAAAADAAAAAARGGWRRSHAWRSNSSRPPRARRVDRAPETVEKARKVDLLAPRRRGRPRAGRARSRR